MQKPTENTRLSRETWKNISSTLLLNIVVRWNLWKMFISPKNKGVNDFFKCITLIVSEQRTILMCDIDEHF